MAKSQKRSNRELKKPKKAKPIAAAATFFTPTKGKSAPMGLFKKKS